MKKGQISSKDPLQSKGHKAHRSAADPVPHLSENKGGEISSDPVPVPPCSQGCSVPLAASQGKDPHPQGTATANKTRVLHCGVNTLHQWCKAPPGLPLLPATGRTHSNKPTSSAWELVGRVWNWKTCYRWLVWRQGRRTGRDSSSTQQHLLPHLPVVRSDEGEASWSYKTPIIIIFLPLTSKCTTGVCAHSEGGFTHTLSYWS